MSIQATIVLPPPCVNKSWQISAATRKPITITHLLIPRPRITKPSNQVLSNLLYNIVYITIYIQKKNVAEDAIAARLFEARAASLIIAIHNLLIVLR